MVSQGPVPYFLCPLLPLMPMTLGGVPPLGLGHSSDSPLPVPCFYGTGLRLPLGSSGPSLSFLQHSGPLALVFNDVLLRVESE